MDRPTEVTSFLRSLRAWRLSADRTALRNVPLGRMAAADFVSWERYGSQTSAPAF